MVIMGSNQSDMPFYHVARVTSCGMCMPHVDPSCSLCLPMIK